MAAVLSFLVADPLQQLKKQLNKKRARGRRRGRLFRRAGGGGGGAAVRPLLRHPGRMTAPVGFDQFPDRDVSVDGRRFQLGVTEHRLDMPDVAAVVQQRRGERMPQRMASPAFFRERTADQAADMVA